MQIRWESDAINDLIEIREFIERENPESASRLANKILNPVDILIEHPLLAKAGRIHKTREHVVSGTPYTLVYLAESELITVLRVFHQSKKWKHLNE
ncbi:type II toxin-antitoxin system mRNA interferase toxin, RelE/StbE family [Cocleimonas flava]|uniref:Addiction module RelE/StbE family toxin n=1 Tax=Cocleimonas flava TaxID=634765 RepID=A0A4R1EXN4_9GAMM|nr:type II toxin-antitoxin system RelE/ParE family toxin [Cocleimonas flava]TCJ84802.1 addiction module RelE/StbE family toxin [Cocleimonas flava]